MAGAPSRIVNVASLAQRPIEFDNVMLERDYDACRAYGQSKLAQILFTQDLAAGARRARTSRRTLCIRQRTWIRRWSAAPASNLAARSKKAPTRSSTSQHRPNSNCKSGLFFNGKREMQRQCRRPTILKRERSCKELSERLSELSCTSANWPSESVTGQRLESLLRERRSSLEPRRGASNSLIHPSSSGPKGRASSRSKISDTLRDA